MKAAKSTVTKKRKDQPIDAVKQLEIEIVAGQVLTLANCLTQCGQGLSWTSLPDKATVRGIEDMVQMIVEKSTVLLTMIKLCGRRRRR